MQRLDREHKRAPYEPVDDEPVLVRVYIGDARMATLEMQAAGRDHPVEQVQRRARGADARRRRIGRRGNGPCHLVLEMRGLAVGGKTRARLLHPRLDGERLRHCARDARAGRTLEKNTATENSIAGSRLSRSRILHWQSPRSPFRKT